MWVIVPPVLCALMAVIPSHVMGSIGRAVKQARQLGNYHLEKLVGVGGMSEVYQASHRLLARPAAVNWFRPPNSASATAPGGR